MFLAHSVWVRELRAPFLLLPLVFVPIGVAIAWIHGSFNPLTALLTLVGALCLHAGVNILNDYFDYKSGIDIITTPTPFSGGSRILPSKELTPNNVLTEGMVFLVAGISIGAFFIVTFQFSLILILLLAIAAISVVGYSTLFARVGMGELLAGLNFGPLLVVGTYYVQTRTISAEPIFVGFSVGMLTSCILYINEFPDTAADSEKGRRHLVARWGKEIASKRYKFLLGSVHAAIVLGVILRFVTPFALISLLTIPMAVKANRELLKNHDGTMELIPAMAETVKLTLFTGGLIFLGYVVAGISIYYHFY